MLLASDTQFQGSHNDALFRGRRSSVLARNSAQFRGHCRMLLANSVFA